MSNWNQTQPPNQPPYQNHPDPADRGDFGRPVSERLQYAQQSPQSPKLPPKKMGTLGKAAIITGSIVGGLVLLGSLASMNGDGTATTAATDAQPTVTVTVTAPSQARIPVPTVTVTKPGPTVTAPPPRAAAAITEDGVYLVGSEIKPGTYRSAGGGTCYWARLSSTNGDLDAIIANNLGGGRQVVTIKSGDKAFETTDCGEWTRVR